MFRCVLGGSTVGDDLEGDVLGAREAGMIGVAVRTGKYRPEDEERIQAAAPESPHTPHLLPLAEALLEVGDPVRFTALHLS